MIRMILNYACMLDPNSTWSARMREENKPWKPRHAQPTNDAATTSNATSDTKTASNPSAIPSSTTDDVKYYLEGDAWWDILRGGVSDCEKRCEALDETGVVCMQIGKSNPGSYGGRLSSQYKTSV
jgi:hypothetical protein